MTTSPQLTPGGEYVTDLTLIQCTYVVILGAAFGYSNKMADMMNEHGLYWFRGGSLLFGAAFAVTGSLLMLQSATLATYYSALTLSWFLLLKLDYPNHAIAGVTMIIVGFAQSRYGNVSIVAVAILASSMVGYRLARDLIIDRFHNLRTLFRLRPDIYLFALGWSVAASSPLPIISTGSGMLVVEIVTYRYSKASSLAA